MSKPSGDDLAKLRHDLRTPLNQILGYSELLQETAEEDGDEERADDLGKIHSAATQLLVKIEGLFIQLAEAPEPATQEPARDSAPQEPAPRDSAPQEPGAQEPARDSAPQEFAPQESAQVETAGAPPAVQRRTDAATPPETNEETSAAPVLLEEYRDEPPRVLVVDDDPLNRDMLSRRLAKCGCLVSTAESGRGALRLIGSQAFDVVLLDVMMPELSGTEVLSRVRESRGPDELPIIMATARDASSEVVEALGLGANDYVTKPIDLPVVLARVTTQLRLKRSNERIRKLAEQLQRSNHFIRQTFGRYLTDEVVDSLLDRPEGLAMGGESRSLTILMSDIRGFSSISERMAPHDVVRMLNAYLGRMTEVIQEYGGTIDEFIGDAILVIFGAPTQHENDAERAIACALAMQNAMTEVNRLADELALPRLEMGIGINTGEVVVGNIGSERRAKYGVVGRHVNLAARIEAYTFGGQVLVSESTLREVGNQVRVDQQMEVCPKGAKKPMKIYEVGAIGGQYEVSRPLRGETLLSLDSPVPLRFAVLDGIHVPDYPYRGALTALSLSEGTIVTDEPMRTMVTVKLEFLLSDTKPMPGEIYGKVTAADPAAKSFILHFTSVDAEVEDFLMGLVTALEATAG